MAEYTYADVIIDPEDPRVEIGKEYYFGYNPADALRDAKRGDNSSELKYVNKDQDEPFMSFRNFLYPCIIRKKESEEEEYVPFDLSNEEDRAKLREAWIRPKGRPSIGLKIIAMNIDCVFFHGERGQSTGALFEEYEFIDGTPCGKLVEEE